MNSEIWPSSSRMAGASFDSNRFRRLTRLQARLPKLGPGDLDQLHLDDNLICGGRLIGGRRSLQSSNFQLQLPDLLPPCIDQTLTVCLGFGPH